METPISPRRQRTPQKLASWRGQGGNTPRKHSSAKKNRLLNYLASRGSSPHSALSSSNILSNSQRIILEEDVGMSSSRHSNSAKYDSSWSTSLDPIPDDTAVLPGKENGCYLQKEEVIKNLEGCSNEGKKSQSNNRKEKNILTNCFPPLCFVSSRRRRQDDDDAYIQAATLIHLERQKFDQNQCNSTTNRQGMRRLLDIAQGCYGLTLFLPIEYWEDYQPLSTPASSPATTISTTTDTTTTSTAKSIIVPNKHYSVPLDTTHDSTFDDTRDDETLQQQEGEEDDDDDEVLVETDDDDTNTFPPILSRTQMQYINSHGLPPTVSLMTWIRAYSLQRDGDCFLTMFHKVSHYNNTLIVIKTEKGDVLGGYADTPWGWANGNNISRSLGHTRARSCSFFGSGRAFLFATHPHAADGNAVESSTNRNQTTRHPSKPCIYKWTGENEYSQICDVDAGSIGMGGGGAFGFFVQDDFTRGSSGPCQTFANPSLVGSHSDGNFEISDFEVYGFMSMSERLFPGSLSRSSSFASSVNSSMSRSMLSTRSMSSIL